MGPIPTFGSLSRSSAPHISASHTPNFLFCKGLSLSLTEGERASSGEQLSVNERGREVVKGNQFIHHHGGRADGPLPRSPRVPPDLKVFLEG